MEISYARILVTVVNIAILLIVPYVIYNGIQKFRRHNRKMDELEKKVDRLITYIELQEKNKESL